MNLLPLRAACQRAGIAPKTALNQRGRKAAGLPASPWADLPMIRIGARWFVEAAALEAFLATLAAGNGNPRATGDNRNAAPSGANRTAPDLRVVEGEHS